MADLFGLSDVSSLTESGSAIAGSALSTGDLRRKYNFGDRVSELAIAQDPFFRMLSKVAKKPTDDSQFKFTERRPSYHKRYAYVTKHGTSVANLAQDDASVTATNIQQGDTYYFQFMTDYKSAGNVQNVSGQSTGEITVGDSGTSPEFFLTNQVIKINLTSTAGGGANTEAGKAISDYALVRITAVGDTGNKTIASTTTSVRLLTGTVVRAASGELLSFASNVSITETYDLDIATVLEPMRVHVVGSAYAEGSSLAGETWNDNPYSTSYGQTQIFRTEFGMTNTARATALKYEPNEWARIWRDKLIEHKWDIEQASLFGKQGSSGTGNDTVYYTQGAVDFVLQSGNIFSLTHSSKTADDFLDDMSKYLDPRYNNSAASVYFCDTATYHWLLKLGSSSHTALFENQVNGTTNGRWDFATSGKKSLFGVDLTNIVTPYGDIKVSRCIALDHSAVKILGVNLKHVKYRPLVGNGLNRDTAVYVGVQSLENTGADKRVDMILTEAGFEYSMPEAHAIWK